MDLPGAVTLMIAMIPLLTVAQFGQAWGWGALPSVACYVTGALRTVAFLVAERRARDDALLALRLFRNRAFAIGAGQSLIANTGMFAGMVLLPLYLRLVKGYSPTAAGLLTLSQVAGTLVCSVMADQVTSRTGAPGR